MSIKHPKVTVLSLLVQMGHTKHFSLCEDIYFKIFCRLLMKYYSDAVNPNTPHILSVCVMFIKIVQYLKLSMFYPDAIRVTVMTSAS